MEEQINLELVKLQEELINLSDAVSQIDKAKESASATVEAVREIQRDYSDTLKSLNQKYEDFLDSIKEKADKEIGEISRTHLEHINEVGSLMQQYKSLAEASARLPEQIEDVDFPVRLDKIDISISDVNRGFLNTQKLVDNLQNGIKLQLKKNMELENKVDKQNIKFKSLRTYLVIIILLMLGLLGLNLKNMLF